MSTTDIAAATEDRAVLVRLRTLLGRLTPACRLIGIRSAGAPTWRSGDEVDVDGTRVRVATCPSVLAVLDAVAAAPDDPGVVVVVLTNLPESDLGDAVLAKLHRGKLFDADRYTLLGDALGARGLDPRIRADAWLVDALIALAAADALPPTAGASISRRRAVALVATARLGVDPDEVDLPALVAAFDDTAVRHRWRALPEAERAGLTEYLRDRHGGGAAAVAALAETRDDVLAELLVAQAVTTAPAEDTRAVSALGGLLASRFGAARPHKADLAAAGAAAAVHAAEVSSARLSQQLRHADAILVELDAADLAGFSPVLPRGFVERLALAARTLDDTVFTALELHRDADGQRHRIDRVRAAQRLHRWLDDPRDTPYTTVVDALTDHARRLAWVDRALARVRAGDADPRVAQVLDLVATRAGAARAARDLAFAAKLTTVDDTPADGLAVETLLPRVVAPLAATAPVLLVVVDGMSGAVASELAEGLTDHSGGWTEIVRAVDGGRNAVLAALPTETQYSRASLFRAALKAGDQAAERAAFAAHSFWPLRGATLVHKSGVAGRDGSDLGADLEAALLPGDGPAVVAVVLNAVDDSLAKGRQSLDPGWRPSDVTGLTELLNRAAVAERIVVLTSDHGHVLEHGSELRPQSGGGARWRPDDGSRASDEVLVSGPRVLTPQNRAILAATDTVRYGARTHGYHGGATLAEAAIPLIVLLPPGVDVPEGWGPAAPSAPSWWDGSTTPAATPAAAAPSGRRASPRKPVQTGEGLFDLPAEDSPAARSAAPTRGSRLIASTAFRDAYAEQPANRVPDAAVFHAVVDALVAAGGRLPLTAVAAAAGAAARNPRGLVSTMGRVLNRDSYPVISLVDSGRAVALNLTLLDEQFPVRRP